MPQMPTKDEWLEFLKITGEVILLAALIVTIVILFHIIGGTE